MLNVEKKILCLKFCYRNLKTLSDFQDFLSVEKPCSVEHMQDILYMQTFQGFMGGGRGSNYGLLFREKAEQHLNVMYLKDKLRHFYKGKQLSSKMQSGLRRDVARVLPIILWRVVSESEALKTWHLNILRCLVSLWKWPFFFLCCFFSFQGKISALAINFSSKSFFNL